MTAELEPGSVKETQAEVVKESRMVDPEVPFFGGMAILNHVPYAGEAPPVPVRQEPLGRNLPA